MDGDDRKTYIDKLGIVALLKIVEHRGIVEIGEVGHVLTLFILGWIDLLQLVFLEGSLLKRTSIRTKSPPGRIIKPPNQ